MNFRIDGRGLATALLLTALVATGCSDTGDRAKTLLNQGISYLDRQEYSKAQQAINQSLKLDHKVAESYFYLGKISLVQGDVSAAINYYKKAIALNVDYINARIQLGHVYANARQLNEAQVQVDAIILSDTGNIDARALQALILFKQGKEQDAEATLQKILKSAPDNVTATEMLAKYYLAKDNENKALHVLEQSNKASGGTEDRVLKQLFAIYSNRKLSSEAERVLLQLVKNNQNNLQYYRGLITFYARQDRINDAVLIIRESISNDPGNDDRYQLLIDLYKSHFGLHKAITETRQLINDKPEVSYLRLALGRLYAADKQVSNAEAVYQGVVDMERIKPNGLIAKVEISKIYLQRNELAKAEQLISDVLIKNPKQEDALLLRSRIAMQQKDFNQASLLIDMVIQENPDNAQAHMQKAVILEGQGKLDESLTHIDAVLSKNDRLVQVLKLKVRILSRQRNFDQLESVFTKLETVSPNTVDGFLGNGRLYLSKKKYRQALQKYEKAYSLKPESVEALRGLIAAKVSLGDIDGAETLLNNIIKKNPQHSIAIELLGNVYFSRKEYTQAEKEFLHQLDVGTDSKTIYIQLAQVRMKLDDEKGAYDALIMGIEKHPSNLNLRIKLAQAYVLAGELDEAEKSLENAVDLAPRNSQLKAMLSSVRNKQQQ